MAGASALIFSDLLVLAADLAVSHGKRAPFGTSSGASDQ